MTPPDTNSTLLHELSPYILIFGIVCFVTVIILTITRKQAIRSLKATQSEKDIIEGEEHRMFEFLHMLGTALEHDHSEGKLHREIVEGLITVVDAVGGAIYLLSSNKRYLEPAYLSENCPQLIGLPVEVFAKTKDNSAATRQAINSAIRLSKIPADEGVLGSVFSNGVPQLIPQMKSHEAFRDSFVHYDQDTSAMIAPLVYGGQDLGVIAIARAKDERVFTANEFTLFQAASEQAAFALGNAKIHHEASEKKSIENDLRIAREVQSILLPNKDPEISGYRIIGTNKPAKIISGDYFDYIPMDEHRTAIVIADVTGKGVAAGLLMAMCRSALRAELRKEKDPLIALSHVNKQIYADIREDMFISLAIYIINDQDGKIQLICAGHDRAPLYRKDGEIEWLKPPGLALGLDDGDVFSRVTKSVEFELHSGDSLLLYTDGVTEALNTDQDEYGEQRMAKTFQMAARRGAESIILKLHKDLDTFVGGYRQMDDITTIAIEKR